MIHATESTLSLPPLPLANPKFLECWRLMKSFPTPRGLITAVADFTLNIAECEFVSIIGHSGCGKSTVLSMIAGLHSIDRGGMILDQREIEGAGPERAVVFQSPNLLPWLTALENVQLAIDMTRTNLPASDRQSLAKDWLVQVGLGRAFSKKPAELSQGMQQRVGIARAFAMQPKVLLLDEPFGMLDSLTRIELQDLLLDVWTAHRMTAIMVTHDVDEAVLMSDRIVMMSPGPNATIGKVTSVPFARPRNRDSLLDSHAFDLYRQEVLSFLGEVD